MHFKMLFKNGGTLHRKDCLNTWLALGFSNSRIE